MNLNFLSKLIEKFNLLRIGQKLTILVLLINTAGFILIFYYNSVFVKKQMVAQAYMQAELIAERFGVMVKIELDRHHNAIYSLAGILEEYERIPKMERRKTFNLYLRKVLEKNDEFLTVWTVWEKNAIDNSDKDFINKEGSNQNGRYASEYMRINNNIKLIEPSTNEEIDTASWYTIPMKSGKELLMDPYWYKYPGIEGNYFETSIVIPIQNKGKPIGVIGIDITLDSIQKITQGIKPFRSGYAFLISNDGRIVTHPDKSLIGKTIGEVMPESKILEDVNKSESRMILVIAAIFFLTTLTLIYITFNIRKSIKSVLKEADKLSREAISGHLNYRSELKSIPPEFRSLVSGYNQALDTIMKPLNLASSMIKNLAEGKVGEMIDSDQYPGDYADLMKSLNMIRLSLVIMIREITVAVEKASHGDFGYRCDVDSLNGSFKQVMKGINDTLIKAQEFDRLRSAFLANMSHEIRTPMNGIIGFSSLLKINGSTDELSNQYIEIINECSNQLLGIINDIIDISKIESGTVHKMNHTVNLNSILEEIHFFYKPQADQHKLELFYSKGLPDESAIVNTDSMKLKQILNNLINNAFKFTERGSIQYGYTLKEGMVEFFITDTGIGISDAHHELIFDRFRQVENDVTRQYGGTGIGLSITRGLVELLSGKIWVDSILGKGSTFYFTIPYNLISLPSHGLSGNSKTQKYNWQAKKILIAEDEPYNFKLLKEYLAPTGIKITYAENGKDAVNFFNSDPDYNLILLDIKMPNLSGYDVLKHLQLAGNKIPVIAQTAHALSEDRDRAIKEGFNDYIAKPINKDLLIAKIARLIT